MVLVECIQVVTVSGSIYILIDVSTQNLDVASFTAIVSESVFLCSYVHIARNVVAAINIAMDMDVGIVEFGGA